MRTIVVLISLLLGITSVSFSQGTDVVSSPSSTNVRWSEFPQITKDGRVVIRFKAPAASTVQALFPRDKTYDLTKDSEGMWSVITDPQVPGFHYYTLVIDGGDEVADPDTEAFPARFKLVSGVEIPTGDEDFFLIKDVPHGEITCKWYFSKTTGEWRRAYVYLPPDYLKNPERHYPVLYLQHGSSEDERNWGMQGHADFILDNLIAAGKARPMIIVMGKGYAQYPSEGYSQQVYQRARASEALNDVFINDLIPMVDSTFRTIPDREHRAMAGLSMGGGQTYRIVFSNPGVFGSVGLFSAALRLGGNTGDLSGEFNGIFSDPEAFNEKFKLVFIGIGTKESERLYNASYGLHTDFEKLGINHVYYESPGTDHEWHTWRRDLYQFAQLLFK